MYASSLDNNYCSLVKTELDTLCTINEQQNIKSTRNQDAASISFKIIWAKAFFPYRYKDVACLYDNCSQSNDYPCLQT